MIALLFPPPNVLVSSLYEQDYSSRSVISLFQDRVRMNRFHGMSSSYTFSVLFV